MPDAPNHQGLLSAFKRAHDDAIASAAAKLRELEEARELRDRARNELVQAMNIARREGMSWTAIGEAMGVSAQAASQMFKRAG